MLKKRMAMPAAERAFTLVERPSPVMLEPNRPWPRPPKKTLGDEETR